MKCFLCGRITDDEQDEAMCMDCFQDYMVGMKIIKEVENGNAGTLERDDR